MPLLDHFHPPLSRSHPWRSFHGAWASAMARLLNAGVLPPGFYAVPFLDSDTPVVVNTGSTVPQPWTPPAPASAVAVEWDETDDVRVEVRTDDGDPRLVASIELVSPRNKDRPRAREAFASKCADNLRRGCGVVVVDVVSTRRADLRGDLLSALGVEPDEAGQGTLTATSYRSVGRNGDGRLLTWQSALEVGQPLPVLPLWLVEDAVPLDLEASHTAACIDLQIRLAG